MEGNSLYNLSSSVLELGVAVLTVATLFLLLDKQIIAASILCALIAGSTVLARALYARYEAFRDAEDK
jgi:hypothetical protein